MNTTLLAAAAVLTFVGLIHSLLGEVLIFRHLRRGGLVPSESAAPLRSRQIRILWASWHIVTVFGLAFVAILLRIATATDDVGDYAVRAIAVAALVSAALVFVATRGRHPGWVGLLCAALFLFL